MDPRKRTKQLGAKEKARRQKCDVRVLGCQENRVFQKNYMRIGARKLLRMCFVLARVFMEVNNLEVEGTLSTMTTLSGAEGVLMNRWRRAQQKVWRKQYFGSVKMETSERTCKSSHVRNLRLGDSMATAAHLAV